MKRISPMTTYANSSQTDHQDILRLLQTAPDKRQELFDRANDIRRQHMGDDVYMRGIVEFSNICANNCHYCGIRASNKNVRRYSMSEDEILDVAKQMPEWKQSTIVLQSGEASSPQENRRIGEIVKRIKSETPLAVTLSVGNRPKDVYKFWKDCGVDRFLLRFETSDPRLFSQMHPDCTLDERLACLDALQELCIQVGSGFMIGLPGETLDILADNILFCRQRDFDMIGIGPFISHPDTPLANLPNAYANDTAMFFVALSVLRIFNPDAHIPATTAFDAVFPSHEGRNLALQRGANIFMPNNTPQKYRGDYLLYPNKPCVDEDTGQCSLCLMGRLSLLGRPIGEGPGHSIKKRGNRGQ